MSEKSLMALKKAFEKAGGKSALARAINVSRQVVNNWERRGTLMPPDCAILIEQKFGIPVDDLRPDMKEHWEYLRNSSKREINLPRENDNEQAGQAEVKSD